ncbi:MAG: bifunctional glutamate N-acetyltransferase/amino-acid acetyltransferase ArgJ [Eubacteriales bacterium]
MKRINGGITAALGYVAAGVEANIKYTNRKDMALIYSETPCVVAGVFTRNLVKAAPVLWDQQIVEEQDYVHAILVNSGIANACTGADGYSYCQDSAKMLAMNLGVRTEHVLVASTGVIGMQLPMDKISKGIPLLVKDKERSEAAGLQAAQAIMTTDTTSKEVAVQVEIDGTTVTIGGMCKGSGMIHPDMCTMLGFLTTDVSISQGLLQEALSEDVKDTFNMVSVDGDTSTNDTVLVLANGAAGNPKISSKNQAYATFVKALNEVTTQLSKMIAGDGEGATALFETTVIHAQSKEQARMLSKSVICSNLTKAAIYGHDANWGRILCAMGYSGATFHPDKMDLYFESKAGRIQIYHDGVATTYSEEEATTILSEPEVRVVVDLRMGTETATAWGCDLTYDYVKINADYRS